MLITSVLVLLALQVATGGKLPPPPPGPSTPVFQNECKDPSLNDCPPASNCVDQFYGFTCQCKPGYVDKSPDKDNPGRLCVLASGDAATEAPQENQETEAPTTVAPSTRKHRVKGSKSNSKTEPIKSDITKSPLDELAKDAVSPKPKAHHRSKPKNNTGTEQPNEEQEAHKENESSKAALRDAFAFFDSNQDGKINFTELKAATKALKQDISNEELRKMLTTADKNGDGVVSFPEFQDLMRSKPSAS